MVRMHAGQLDVPVETVRRLVADQFPRWADLPVRALGGQGTVNAIFRIGDRFTARFPLQPGVPAEVRRSLEKEAAAAELLAGRTRFPTPEHVAFGEPGEGYPLPWSVQTWIPGTVVASDGPGEPESFARDLAEFITEVRAIPTGGRTFAGAGRGGVLSTHDAWVQSCLRSSAGLLDVPTLNELWRGMRELPRGDGPDVTNHSDLIPGNVLVSAGRLAGVLDVCGLGPADPVLLEHDVADAALPQVPAHRQPGLAAADDRHREMRGGHATIPSTSTSPAGWPAARASTSAIDRAAWPHGKPYAWRTRSLATPRASRLHDTNVVDGNRTPAAKNPRRLSTANRFVARPRPASAPTDSVPAWRHPPPARPPRQGGW